MDKKDLPLSAQCCAISKITKGVFPAPALTRSFYAASGISAGYRIGRAKSCLRALPFFEKSRVLTRSA